jgi:sugar phosphate isomerase/epimerase
MGQQSAALQLWTVREAFAADAERALSRVRAAGFAAVELAPLPPGLEPARLAESLARHDLAVVSIHGDIPTPATIGNWSQLARERSIRWKDGPCVHGEPMTALGQGKVDAPRILRAITRPVDWIIELNECVTDPLEAARQSRVYLESISGQPKTRTAVGWTVRTVR